MDPEIIREIIKKLTGINNNNLFLRKRKKLNNKSRNRLLNCTVEAILDSTTATGRKLNIKIDKTADLMLNDIFLAYK